MLPLIWGLSVAAFGALLSYLTNTWQISFIISLTAAAISLMATSMLRNTALISSRKGKIKGQEDKAVKEAEAWAKASAIFGFPNAIIAILLYFRLYR